MIVRRAWFAAPAAAALVLASMTSAAAEGDVFDFGEVPDPGEPLVVAEVAEGTRVVGIEVSRRAITWGSLPTEEGIDGPLGIEGVGPIEPDGPWISARGYTPDLGKKPLTLGATITPLIPNALNEVSTDAWVVGFDPFTGTELAAPSSDELALVPEFGYVLRVKNMSTHVITEIGIPPVFDSDAGSLAVWGNTAMVGPILVNLVTGQLFDVVADFVADPPQCLDSYGGVLADGVLLLHDLCDGGVAAVDVPASGITGAALETTYPVIEGGNAGYLAASRGLIVWADDDETSEGPVVRWKRITDPVDAYREFSFGEATVIPFDVIGLRVQGERFVTILAAEDSETVMTAAVVFEAETGEDGPVAGYLMDIVEGPTEPLGLTALTADPTSDMNLEFLAVDLYGRTLAWLSGGQILAATLPALPDDATVIDGPDKANPGKPVTVTGTGFQPGEEVAVWLTSTPVLLGLGTAGTDGSFTGTFLLPADTAVGDHTLTLVGVESGWDAELAVVVAALNPGLEVDTGR